MISVFYNFYRNQEGSEHLAMALLVFIFFFLFVCLMCYLEMCAGWSLKPFLKLQLRRLVL